jgi:hypothetical protein
VLCGACAATASRLELGVGEQRDPFGRGLEDHPLSGEAGADPERDREVRFAGAWWSEHDHVLFGVEEVELAKVLDHRLLDRALEGEVELLECLSCGEAGGADPALAAVRLPRRDLSGEERLGELLIAPLLRAGAVGELRKRPGCGGGFELAEQVGELGGVAHALKAS